ncbi:hypothetical protein [Rhodocaloribacter sp.]
MANVTITCTPTSACYGVSVDPVDVDPGGSVTFNGPVGATVGFANPQAPVDRRSKTIGASGSVTFNVNTSPNSAGTYFYGVTGIPCATYCGGDDRPAMQVN